MNIKYTWAISNRVSEIGYHNSNIKRIIEQNQKLAHTRLNSEISIKIDWRKRSCENWFYKVFFWWLFALRVWDHIWIIHLDIVHRDQHGIHQDHSHHLDDVQILYNITLISLLQYKQPDQLEDHYLIQLWYVVFSYKRTKEKNEKPITIYVFQNHKISSVLGYFCGNWYQFDILEAKQMNI